MIPIFRSLSVPTRFQMKKIQFFVSFDIESCEIVHFTILCGFYCSLCTTPKNKKAHNMQSFKQYIGQ